MFCITVSTIIICVLAFISDSIVIEPCKNHIELKNWLHTKTFTSSEVRNCVLKIKNGTSRKIYFACNSIIRSLMTDLTEIINSQKHIDYAVYKKHCSRDAGGSHMKNCNFTGIEGGSQNKTLVSINLESAQYFGDVNRWFSKSDVVVLMVGHQYLITEGKNDTWFPHFWNDFDLFLPQYKIWIKNSSSRHLTYITPTYCNFAVEDLMAIHLKNSTQNYTIQHVLQQKNYMLLELLFLIYLELCHLKMKFHHFHAPIGQLETASIHHHLMLNLFSCMSMVCVLINDLAICSQQGNIFGLARKYLH